MKGRADMRADLLLVKLGYARSRVIAKEMIESGGVRINGKTVKKPSAEYGEQDELVIETESTPKYVSRGGYKLEGILDSLEFDVSGNVCIDIGASTGGFTDCLLQRGASRVYCIDSGSNQLATSIASRDEVVVLEKTNARYIDDSHIPERADVIVMDVSFISQTLIHQAVKRFLKPDGYFITLIKPQFELERSALGKGGIVKSKEDRHTAIKRVLDSCAGLGLYPVALYESSIKGGDGNIEYTAAFVTSNDKAMQEEHLLRVLSSLA